MCPFLTFAKTDLDMLGNILVLAICVLVFWLFCKIIADVFGINKKD